MKLLTELLAVEYLCRNNNLLQQGIEQPPVLPLCVGFKKLVEALNNDLLELNLLALLYLGPEL
jgi:hypothetical protein